MKRLITHNFIGFEEIFSIKHPSTMHLLSKLYMRSVGTMNDRFNVLNKDSEYYLLSRNDNLTYIINSDLLPFRNCCEQRTNEIIDLARKLDKDIYVSWSGGVDSTCIVSSFMMNDRLDRKRFHIIHSIEAIAEYPLFYELLKKEGIHIHNTNNIIENFKTTVGNNICVNGLCGDQLDGSNLHTMKYSFVDYFDDWKEGVRRCLPMYNLDRLISDTEEYAKLFSLNLQFFGEFAWLYNFGVKRTWVAEYMKFLYNSDYTIPFFDTDYFSRYGIANSHKLKEHKQHKSFLYKTDWKYVIYEYTKDEEYFLNKGKDASYFCSPQANFGISVLDEDGYHVYNKDSDLKEIMLPYIKDEYKEFYNVHYKFKP